MVFAPPPDPDDPAGPAREDAIDRAAQGPPRGWERGGRVDELIDFVAMTKNEISTDDLWPIIDANIEAGVIDAPRTPAAIGPAMRRAQSRGVLEQTNRTKSSSRSVTHGRPIAVWRVTDVAWDSDEAVRLRNTPRWSDARMEAGGISRVGEKMDEAITLKEADLQLLRETLEEQQRQLERDIRERARYPADKDDAEERSIFRKEFRRFNRRWEPEMIGRSQRWPEGVFSIRMPDSWVNPRMIDGKKFSPSMYSDMQPGSKRSRGFPKNYPIIQAKRTAMQRANRIRENGRLARVVPIGPSSMGGYVVFVGPKAKSPRLHRQKAVTRRLNTGL